VALRRFLYFSAATTGASIMIIQILGAKMLAPYIGTSHFVWTAQIAITMMALAAGYYAGGWLVDRSHALSRIYTSILVAAIYLSVAILFIEPIAYWCLRYKLAVGSLLTSAFLFFVPLALLAMVGPFMVRVLTDTVQAVGGNIGRLTAISTLGSFVGTVLTGYVVIPYLPNSTTMFLTSILLMTIVAAYFLIWNKDNVQRTVVGMVITFGLLFGYGAISREAQMSNASEKFRGNSNFGLLQVMENKYGTRRFYLNDFLTQNTYDPIEKKSVSAFTYMLHDLARSYSTNVQDVLCIGLGVGIVPMQFAREGATVDVVEINRAVVPVATRFFDFDASKLNLVIGDGRYFLNATKKQYDAIILDAFLGDSSPAHLMTRESFQSMQRLLKPGGTLVINSFGNFDQGRDFFTASLDKTLQAVFKHVRIHSAGNGNVYFVASDQPELAIVRTPDFEQIHSSCREQARSAFNTVMKTNPSSGQILTDDHNPVDFFDSQNREEWRRQMALSMRSN
jgi:spermidine synthase